MVKVPKELIKKNPQSVQYLCNQLQHLEHSEAKWEL